MNLITSRNIKYIVIHCSATPQNKDFHSYHIDIWHKRKGWSEICYNFVITLNGEIEVGRNLDKIPAHVAGFNKNSIAIVYIGGQDPVTFAPKDTRTPQQKQALLSLLSKLKKLYPSAIILGHRDFPNTHKTCPCFNAKDEYKNL